MRRLPILLLLFVLIAVAVPASAGTGAQVIHKEAAPCDVGWSDDVVPVMTDDCWGTNVKTPNGGYLLVLHGQVPDDLIDQFDGPIRYRTGCWSNWFFVLDEGEEPALTTSVRRFTADGRMLEVCMLRAGR